SRSAAPSRQTGPVSSRISWSPRVGSCTTVSSATTSATSGALSSPPRPTTSTGTCSARSARTMPSNWARLRQSTATDRPLCPPVGGPRLLLVRLGPGRLDGSCGCIRAGPQLLHLDLAAAAQRGGRAVGHGQDPGGVAPRGAQRQHGGLLARRGTEPLPEPLQG